MPEFNFGLKPQTYEQLRLVVVAMDREIEKLAYGRVVIQSLIEQEERRLATPSEARP